MDRRIALILLCTMIGTQQNRIHNKSFPNSSTTIKPLSENQGIGTKKESFSEPCSEKTAICALPVQCPAHFYASNIEKCHFLDGRQGICCKTGQSHVDLQRIPSGRASAWIDVDDGLLGKILKEGHRNMSSMRSREVALLTMEHPPVVAIGSPSYGHFRSKRVLSQLPEILDLTSKALQIAWATQVFKHRRTITRLELEWNLLSHHLQQTPLKPYCQPPPECPQYLDKYRRIDGTCNNPNHPFWGAEISPFSRLLPPSYEDGIWLPRLSLDGQRPLPSPRLISTTLFPDGDYIDSHYTMMLMQFGQFISHDVTLSVDTTFPDGRAISCCTKDGTSILPQEYLHDACMPIEVPENDPFFSRYGVRCMNFVRSTLTPREECTLGYVQQLNKVTHFIDASPVYGSNLDEMNNIRSFEGGRLKVLNDYGRNLLPLSQKPDACITMERGSACFDAGDSRTNQVISLVVLHTLFLREHNRIAAELQNLNPHWTDDKIFWEGRRILIAELQVIVYKEFLPCLLGETTMEEFELNLSEDDTYSDSYDGSIEPSITNEFSGGAYRFGHSMVDGLLRLYGQTKMEEMISLSELMFQPARMRKWEFFDEILSTLTTEPVQKVDGFISEALTRYLFKSGHPFGLDLAAINIQRGRDHGLRPYNDYRQLVGLDRMTSFEEFGLEIGSKLQHLYSSIDDLDLWVGGLLEPKDDGGFLGPTFRNIIADQFSRLKKGDRYFFENDPEVNPGHFTIDQLIELKKASMSRIVCDNSDGIMLARQALNAFKKPGEAGNEFYNCAESYIPRIDLRYWQE